MACPKTYKAQMPMIGLCKLDNQ